MDEKSDPRHWLYRLSADAWLRAAETELVQGEDALARRGLRPAVTHARRGAGMAINALMVAQDPPNPRWGRSYMEHLLALARPTEDRGGSGAGEDEIAPEIRQAARDLTTAKLANPSLIKLGPLDRRPLDAAREILAWARTRTASPA